MFTGVFEQSSGQVWNLDEKYIELHFARRRNFYIKSKKQTFTVYKDSIHHLKKRIC